MPFIDSKVTVTLTKDKKEKPLSSFTKDRKEKAKEQNKKDSIFAQVFDDISLV